MHKIGIISDTHGMLRPEVIDTLKECELILHGGDINNQEILDVLSQIAPIHAVRGNNDKKWANSLPESLTLTICNIPVFMTHNKNFIPKDLTGIKLVVYGHSHKYEERISDGIFYLNPGSCGPRRFRQDITLAILYINDDTTFKIEKVLISTSKNKDAEKACEKTEDEKITANIASMLPTIMREIDAGKTVEQIAAKHRISMELSDQINRMYLTHPGVDVEGILRRLGL